MTRKSKPVDPVANEEPDFLIAIKRTPSGHRKYDSNDHRFNGVQPESFTLQKYTWQGLLTIKFYSGGYSKNNAKGQDNRRRFLEPFMRNLRMKFRISDREFNWVGCEEYGFSDTGHLHVLFSFDYLKEKGREDKIPKLGYFSKDGDFDREGMESLAFTCKSLGINPSSVVFHWSPMWENNGLVDYFCKIEFGRERKDFGWSKFWKKHGILNAA